MARTTRAPRRGTPGNEAPATLSPELFAFLRELADNNDRAWFAANKARYEAVVRDPALELVRDFAPYLAAISTHMVADPRPSGGSLFRIHRDVRFSRDKAPYKTHAGIHFRHERARDVHAPGYYLHLEPGHVFVAAGSWRPDGPSLGKIRDAICAAPDDWRDAAQTRLAGRFRLEGDALKRAPAGYDADHPLIEDLKRKDFAAVAELSEAEAASDGFLERVAETCGVAAPLMRFLCRASDVTF